MPLPAITVQVVDGMDEQAGGAVEAAFDEDAPPVVVGQLDDVAAEALDRRQLRLGRALRDDDRRLHAAQARRVGDSLRHVAGARGDDAVGQLLLGGLEHRVAGAADLEGVDRLERLELEIDLRVGVGVEPDERRPDGDPRDRLPRAAESPRAGSEVDLDAGALGLGAAEHVLGGGEVLDREAERLEHGQLRVRAAPSAVPIRSSPISPRMLSGPIAPSRIGKR